MTEEPALDDVSELVIACLARIEVEGLSAIDALCAEHPGRADALRARLRRLLGAGLVETPAEVPARLGDFVLGRKLGGGGMGVVYAAVQEPLGREVALKLVRPDQLVFADVRERFRREVRLVARLQHPSIVPVHTVGEEHGLPYLAMEKIDGATLAEVLGVVARREQGRDLAEALAALAGSSVDAPSFEGGWNDVCVRIARHVALALEHAHRRDVVHRDVKPSNVMLSVDGRVLLFDFGLGRAADAGRLTTSGTRVGSLAYMAPEQVRGDEADARSDVYGLGATLCELLTGEPPHVARGEALVAEVLAGDPVPLRRRNAAISRDLETVVQRALEVDPARRYASADAFARDLQRVLERRPVEARRTGPVGRVARWTARHPARAAALALAVLLPAALAVQQGLAARREADLRVRAEENLDRAVAAVETFLGEVGGRGLEDVPRMEPTRLRLLEDALAFLEELMPQRPSDPAMQRRWGRLRRSTGEMLAALDRLDEAEGAYRDALDVLDAGPGDAAGEREAATAWNGLGNVLERVGRLPEALLAWTNARAAWRDAADVDGLTRLARIERNRGRVLGRLGRSADAAEAFEAARVAAEGAAARDPASSEARRELGAVLGGQAGVLIEAGDVAAGGAALDAALAIVRPLLDLDPGDPWLRRELAVACMNGHAFAPTRAASLVREGTALARGLVDDFPSTPEYRRVLGSLLLNRAVGEIEDGRLDAGLELLEEARTETAPLAASDAPDVFDNLLLAGRVGMNLATLLVQREERAAACEPGAWAVAALDRALALVPGDARAREALAWARVQEAYGRVARGEFDRAEALVDDVGGLRPSDAALRVAAAEVLAGCAAGAPGRADLATRAFALLAEGRALGFADLDYLRTCAELAPLRVDARFAGLVAPDEPSR